MNLDDSVKSLPKVGDKTFSKLTRLGISTISDLLWHIPIRYEDYSKLKMISLIKESDEISVKCQLTSITQTRSKRGLLMTIANFSDETGKIQAVWFNSPYIIRTLSKNQTYFLSGKIKNYFGRLSMISPSFEKIDKEVLLNTKGLIPIYPQTTGITSRQIRNLTYQAIKDYKKYIGEIYPKQILTQEKLVDLRKAFIDVHYPKNLDDSKIAKIRLSFDELVRLHVKSQLNKRKWKNNKVAKLNIDEKLYKKFTKLLPFKLTQSQVKSIHEIYSDLGKNYPMNRLLEGDVGSGKTIVAAAATLQVYATLAQQHYKAFTHLFDRYKMRIGLVTAKSKTKEVGRLDLIIGTQALLYNKVKFDDCSLVIIDEQHKFGVKQRINLFKKSKTNLNIPHFLTMTATPIPRTVAMTAYGNMELSVLKELPANRKPTKTWIVTPKKRNSSYAWVEEVIAREKVQVFVVCPLIDESFFESMTNIKSAKREFENVQKLFPKRKVGLMHGKMSENEKNKIIDDFHNKKIDILVSTPVIEVGIDIANANVMLIETADRFGLAQLHQLRGRIGRGDKNSYCLVYTENKSPSRRLTALKNYSDGFKLAEIDLKMRGPGEIIGTKQHGYTNLKVASWGDISLIKRTYEFTNMLFEKYPKTVENIIGDKLIN